MPNKYSHALVIPQNGSYNLFDHDRPHTAKTIASSKSTKSSTSSRYTSIQSSQSQHRSIWPNPSERIRLGSPIPSPANSIYEPKSPTLHRKNSSVETQIYAPIRQPESYTDPDFDLTDSSDIWDFEIRPQKQKQDTYKGQAVGQDDRRNKSRHPTLSKITIPKDVAPLRVKEKTPPRLQTTLRLEPEEDGESYRQPSAQASRHSSYREDIRRQGSLVASRGQKSQRSPSANLPGNFSAQHRNRKQSKDTEHSRSRLHISVDPYVQAAFETHTFRPQHPPSPPATPDSAKSCLSFSLETPIDEPEAFVKPPPIPERSPRRSPQGPSPRNSTDIPPEQSSPRRPRTSSAAKSPTSRTFSLTTRTSSLNATTIQPQYLTTSPKAKRQSISEKSARDVKPMISATPFEPFAVDDDDLESLPSTFDFSIMHDDNIGPAKLWNDEINCRYSSDICGASTRGTSFDSAAPPPIGLNRRLPDILKEAPSSPTPKTPKKNTSSFASMFFRSGSAPKVVLYEDTRCATPPIPVDTAMKPVPPTVTKLPESKGRLSLQQDDRRESRYSSKPGPPVGSRNRSVPPNSFSARRRSWFKGN